MLAIAFLSMIVPGLGICAYPEPGNYKDEKGCIAVVAPVNAKGILVITYSCNGQVSKEWWNTLKFPDGTSVSDTVLAKTLINFCAEPRWCADMGMTYDGARRLEQKVGDIWRSIHSISKLSSEAFQTDYSFEFFRKGVKHRDSRGYRSSLFVR